MDTTDDDESYIGVIDYAIFSLMLLLSATISVYYGYFKNKNSSYEEYMFGRRNMPLMPTCMSILASTMSSVALVGATREIYYYGTVVIYAPLGELTSVIFLYFFYIPVFYQHKFTSMFEYVEKRFCKIARSLGSAVYSATQIFQSLIVMYAACSAIPEVTPLPFHIITPILCIVCTLYSVVGGLRGVVWSDLLQTFFMYAAILTLMIVGYCNNIKSGESIFEILQKGGRSNFFEFDPNPFKRHTALSLYVATLGTGTFNICTNQGAMQRYMSLSSYKNVKIVIICFGISMALFLSILVFLSIVIYGTYYNCDPVLSKQLKDSNHIMIYFTKETSKKIPGLTGLVLAGMLSASMSTMSTIINSVSGNIMEDIVKPVIPWNLNDSRTNFCVKGIALLVGIIVTFGILVLDASGGILQIYGILFSLTGGLLIFIFGFGLFFRIANTKGVIAGSIVSLIITFWLGIGIQQAVSGGRIKYPTKIVSVEGCENNVTQLLK